ncbi:hypothetical protein DL93DRAFT_1582762 [Clavulina sp. PMI_390]|nr:hypothetical protein DL93DRAFT_1582762 [Clavulina sp. PMI_390]
MPFTAPTGSWLLLSRPPPKGLARYEPPLSPNLAAMPLQIFHVLAAHLNPRDLLAIGRTSKPLRDLLFRRRAANVWIRCRKQFNFFLPNVPDCPEDLSEPEYANLLFDVGCMVSCIFLTICLIFCLIWDCCLCYFVFARFIGQIRTAGLQQPE